MISCMRSVDDWSAAVRRRKFRESLEDLAETKFNDKWYRRVLGHRRSAAAASAASSSSSLDVIPEHEGNTDNDNDNADEMLIPGKASQERFILLVLAELNIISLYNDIAPLAKVTTPTTNNSLLCVYVLTCCKVNYYINSSVY